MYGRRRRVNKKIRSDRIDLNFDALHRYLWRLGDERNRFPMKNADLAEALGVCYDLARDALAAMCDQGRIRPVAWRAIKIRIYQVCDPELYNPEDPMTHARPATEPQWG